MKKIVVEIEYFKDDVLLTGAYLTFEEFIHQIKTIEDIYDTTEDNFIDLLCHIYNWSICREQLKPYYVYDRDIEKAYKVK